MQSIFEMILGLILIFFLRTAMTSMTGEINNSTLLILKISLRFFEWIAPFVPYHQVAQGIHYYPKAGSGKKFFIEVS